MRAALVVSTALIGAGLFANGTRADAVAEVLFVNGKIHTQNATREVVQALALSGDHIVAVGSNESIGKLKGPDSRVLDLNGRVVLPGIIDAHTHPAGSAQMQGKCSLNDEVLDFATIKQRIQACLKKDPGDPRRWYEVIMVNPTGLSLSARDLDSLRKRPLILEGADGHTWWINSSALKAARIGRDSQDPRGGRIERDATGKPSGTLRDNATSLAAASMPPDSEEHELKLLAAAFDDMRAAGITSVQDAAADDHAMALYKRLYDEHRLGMRVRASLHIKDLSRPAAQVVGDAEAFRKRWSIDPDFLRADAVKIFADGVIEHPSQTAALLAPYLDANGQPTDNRGPDYFTQAGLDAIVSGVDAAGLTVHVHAIGDRGVRAALDAFEAARKANGSRDNRHQIAHLELIDPADFPRFRQLNVIANFQLLWAERDPYIDGGTIRYLGAERSRYLYPARSVADAGGLIAGGSDWGVSSFDAFIAMEHGITRSEKRGAPPLLPEQALTLQQVVDAYSINAAIALKQERTTGSLEAGKRADLIVLDRDIFALDPYDLHDTQVLSTWLNGREVYRAPAPDSGPAFEPAVYGGGDGLSAQTAVIVKTRSEQGGVRSEYVWIRHAYPGATPLSQALTAPQGGKLYDVLTIETLDGAKLTLWFDITRMMSK